jgi:uncharacterized membrane protein
MISLLLNPFEKYNEKQLLISGIGITILGSILGFVFNARFDGVIDLHFVQNTSFFTIVSEIIIDVLCLTILLFILGKYINKKTRFIDILSPVLIARLPFYLLTIFNSHDFLFKKSENLIKNLQSGQIDNPDSNDLFIICLFGLISIGFLIWFVIILYNGFKVATNTKGIKNNIFFAISIIIAEILSKAILSIL